MQEERFVVSERAPNAALDDVAKSCRPSTHAVGAGDPLRGDSAASLPGRRAPWRHWLAGATPREVLARIMNGDPLRLRARAAECVRERAYLLDVDRLLLRSFARVARFAVRYRGDPALDVWLRETIDQALGDLLIEDRERERDRTPIDVQDMAAYVDLARPLGLDPAQMRRVCVAFNRLPDGDRRAFFELVIDCRSLDDVSRERAESASEVARAARRALDAVLAVGATPRDAEGT